MIRPRGVLGIRVWATTTLGLLAAYEALRLVASNCTGSGCEGYIPLSVLLPVVILMMVVVTGVSAIVAARPRRKEGGRVWLSLMVATTLLSVMGPVIGLGVFRDAPEVLVPLASALFALLPVVALGYSFLVPSQR